MSDDLSDYLNTAIECGEIDPDKPYNTITWADGKTYKVTITLEEVQE